MFDFKKFLKEGGIEKYLLEAQFGNDIESRYQYIRPLMSRLPDSARTEAMIDGMEEARAEDDKMAFDFYFVETMKMLGLETELMEADSLINPEAEEIEDDDLAAAADYFDSLAENDKVLDEFLQMPAQEEEEEEEEDEEVVEKEAEVTININLQEGKFEVGDYVVFADDWKKGSPMRVTGMRKMFGSPLHAIKVTKLNGETAEYDETQLAKLMSPEEKANVFVREEVEGEVQSEAMSDQLKINKLLQAANTIEDSLNDVNLELTDDQIDKFTEMILDLRAKAKASLKEGEVLEEGRSIPIARRSISFKNLDILSTVRKNFDQYESIALVKDVMGGGKGKTGTLARITNFEEAINNTDLPIEIEMVNGMDPKGVVVSMLYMIKKGDLNKVVDTLKKEHTAQIKDQQAKLDALNKL